MMSGNSIFFDTAPFIYVVEQHPLFCQKVIDFIADAIAFDKLMRTNVLVYAEFCIKPEQINRQDIIQKFDIFLKDTGFFVMEINLEIARIAAKLRAKYSALKTVDAMQIASAIYANCTDFFTNDIRLKAVQEIGIIVVSEL